MGFIDLDIISEALTNSSYSDGALTFLDVVQRNAGVLLLLLFLSLVALVGLVLVWRKIYGKDKLWRALVPFYNLFQLFRSIDLNPYLSIAVFLPFVGLVPLALFNFYLPRAFGLKGIVYSLAAVCFPWLMLLILGVDKKYEFQYVKGKNVPFKDSFRIPVPGESGYDAASTPNEVGAVGSQISQAAALNMARNEELRREAAERAKELSAAEAQTAPVEQKPTATPTTEVTYDIFDNGTIPPEES